MKFIRRVAKVSPWAVAVAMAFEVGPPTLAQTPKPTGYSSNSSQSFVIDDPAVDIQIAWLGDPALLSCNLVAKVTSEGIELAGFVPNEAMRQKAVQVAKSACEYKVINRLQVQAHMPIPSPKPAVPAELAYSASMILAETLGDKVMGIRIVSPSNGRVDISGNVPSADDKLLISKTLKKVNGCTQIVNKVNATGRVDSAVVVKNAPMTNTPPTNVTVQEPVTKPVSTAKSEPPAVVKNAPVTNVTQAKANVQEPITKSKETGPDVLQKSSTPSKTQATSAPNRTEGIAIIPPPPKPTKKKETVEVASKPKNEAPAEKKATTTVLEPVVGPKLGSASVTDMPKDAKTNAAAANPAPSKQVVKNEPTKPGWGWSPLKPKTPETAKSSEVIKVTQIEKSKSPEAGPELPKPEKSLATEPPKQQEIKPAAKTEVIKPSEIPVFNLPQAKPVEVSKSQSNEPKLHDYTPELPKPITGPAIESPKRIVLIPETSADSSEPKKLEISSEVPKSIAIETPKKIELIPEEKSELPKPELSSPPSSSPSKSIEVTKKTPTEEPKKLELAPELPKPVPAMAIELPKKQLAPETKTELTKPDLASTLKPSLTQPADIAKSVQVAEPKRIEFASPKTQLEAPKPIEPPKKIEIKPLTKFELPKPGLPSAFNPMKPKSLEVAKSNPVEETKKLEVANETPKRIDLHPELTKSPPTVDTLNPNTAKTEPSKPLAVVDSPRRLDLIPEGSKPGGNRSVPLVMNQDTPKSPSTTANPNAGKSSVSDLAVKEVAKDLPKPAMPATPPTETKMVSKAERYSPPAPSKSPVAMTHYTATPPAPLSVAKDVETIKPLNPENTIKGVIRQNSHGAALDTNTARKAIEDICRGGANDISVRETAARQITVAMTCNTQGDWDRLYAKIRNLPEVAGHSVIYNVNIETKAKQTIASNAPMMGIIRANATAVPAEPEIVRTSIENLCKGRGEELEVRTTGKQQIKVGMKVRSTTDWDLLYKKIKELPEVGGYAVIYNVSVK